MSAEEKKREERKLQTFNDEKKLSLSEIISKRFKHRIKVYEAKNPVDVEKMIIRPPAAANDQYAFLNDSSSKLHWQSLSETFGNGAKNLSEQMGQYLRYK